MSNKLNLIITYNKQFRSLAYSCASSLENKDIFVHLNFIDIKVDAIDPFRTKKWYECLEKKVIFINDQFDKLEENEILCISDADIYYFNPNKLIDIKNYMDSKNDLMIMAGSENYPSNTGYANFGIALIKKHKSTKNLFKDMLTLNVNQSIKWDSPQDEQIMFNRLIKERKINYELLTCEDFTMGCYVHAMVRENPNHRIAMLHATCCKNIQKKQEMIDEFLNIHGPKKITWFRTPLTKKEIALYIEGQLQYDSRSNMDDLVRN